MKRLLIVALLPLLLTTHTNNAYANEGRQSLAEEEQKINVASYNPTAPEIQLGYATELSINDSSGVVKMDAEHIQGNINSKGLVYIEAVKGEGDVYYVLEKGGYVLSILAKDNKLISKDGAVVQIKLVDWIYGRNGLADDDGFKSNIVPSGFLPKTGIETQLDVQQSDNLNYAWLLLLTLPLFIAYKGKRLKVGDTA